jgi:hypothetical protein
LTERVDALVAEARQLDIGMETVMMLLRRRYKAFVASARESRR